MARVVTGLVWGTAWTRPRQVSVDVRVWRRVAGVPQGLFTFAGAADAVVLRAVMEHVQQLAHAVPGRWRIEVVASGLEGALLYDVTAVLRDLQRVGLSARLALAPRLRAELRTLCERGAPAAMLPTLPH